MVVFLIEQVNKKKCIDLTQFKELLHDYKAAVPRASSSKEITPYWIKEFMKRHKQNKKLSDALQFGLKKRERIPMKDNEFKKYKNAFQKHLQINLKAISDEKPSRKRKRVT